MKIYTKTGDLGQTSLFQGKRVFKNDLRCEVYGSVDELNSQLGIVVGQIKKFKDSQKALLKIQNELFDLGAELATPSDATKDGTSPNQSIGDSEIQRLEKEIDQMEKKLKPLRNFILPGGSAGSAGLHLARTVCRRSERSLITLHQKEPVRAQVLIYLNRLSDYLFVMARFINSKSKVKDVLWVKKKN
jgi:cob(I)alamin adenosyltransferase